MGHDYADDRTRIGDTPDDGPEFDRIDRTALDEFTTAYIECALWSSNDESTEQGGEPMDSNYDLSDIAEETLAVMVEDCRAFQESFGACVAHDLVRAGHDFWLTRNGHGAGFWDGDWAQEFASAGELDSEGNAYGTAGDYLTAMSRPYGEFNLYVGDDGLIHGQ